MRWFRCWGHYAPKTKDFLVLGPRALLHLPRSLEGSEAALVVKMATLEAKRQQLEEQAKKRLKSNDADDTVRTIVLVVDLGTTGVKCSVWSAPSGEDSPSPLGLSLLFTSDTRHTPLQDPNAIIDCIDACVDDVAKEFMVRGVTDSVGIVGFSTFGMSLVGLDTNDKVVSFSTYRGETIIYRDNNDRTVLVPDKIDPSLLDQESVGVPRPTHNSYALPHMLALAPLVHRYTTVVSLCLERWTGRSRLPISLSEASWFGLLNWRQGKWEDCAQSPTANKVVSTLPPLADYCDLEQGILAETYKTRWPCLMSDRVKLLLGIVDGAASTLGSTPFDCANGGEICVSVGTSAAVRVMMSRSALVGVAQALTGSGCFVHVLTRDRVVLGGALTDGGSAFDVATGLTNIDRGELQAQEESLAMPGDVICLPFFAASGERAPQWAGPSIPGAFVGVDSRTKSEDLVVAAVVGVALRLAEINERLLSNLTVVVREDNAEPPRVFVNGTAAMKSALWKRALAGSLECDLWVYRGEDRSDYPGDHDIVRDDSTARGIALLALGRHIPTSGTRSMDKIWRKPEDDEITKFRAQRARQRRVYSGLLGTMGN